MRIFFLAYPRSFILISNDHCLTLRYVEKNNHCLIKFSHISQTDTSKYKEITNLKFFGLLGFLEVKGSVFFCAITDHVKIGSPRPQEDVYKIRNVEFYCLNTNAYDFITVQRNKSESATDRYNLEHPCTKIRKMFMNGFYYSRDFDLTCQTQDRSLLTRDYDHMFTNFDKRFLWNGFMMKELTKFRERLMDNERDSIDRTEFLTFLIRGFVKTCNTELAGEDTLMTIISRISCAKSSGPFGNNGVDEQGHVSNYIESELVLYNKSVYFAYNQVRGNIPLFYEVDSSLLTTKKVHLSQSYEMNKNAFDRHFDLMIERHSNVVVLNAMRNKKEAEELNSRFTTLLAKKGIPFAQIDSSGDQLKNNPQRALNLVKGYLMEIGAFCYDNKVKVFIGKQLGVFRFNSLNSMSKPGSLQRIVSQEVLHISMFELTGKYLSGDLQEKHHLLWHDNNRVLELIADHSLRKSYKRITDSITNTIVRLYDPINEYISSQLASRLPEFSCEKEIKIFTGTFNAAATLPEQDLSPWIYPTTHHSETDNETVNNDYDLIVIGLEEIIELSTSHMLAIDDSKKVAWESAIKRTLNSRYPNAKDQFQLLWSIQLGGILSMIFVKKEGLPRIKHIECIMKKTGLGGMAANKGGVGISLSYAKTKFCFIVSHLAAGLENNEQRQNDYKTLYKSLVFKGNRKILNHDASFWMGDFNFRIDLDNDTVRSLIELGDYSRLLDHDQLIKGMNQNRTFQFFQELDINFAPTYKFDKGTDNYDSSEKQRIPAWTDRIVVAHRGNRIKQLSYQSAPEIKLSDHKPVYAVFKVGVTIIQEEKRNEVLKELYEERKREIEKLKLGFLDPLDQDSDSQNGSAFTTNDLSPYNINYTENEPDNNLPPPSNDRTKWWLLNGEAAKVNWEIPQGSVVVNPFRPSNPFTETNEPDFIVGDPEED
ncbi:hypothetical protein WICPIJ_002670 [Wickerhamomyces pijperi]|uniref:phosphoinositide 5-phosphatase n=1 Tax=Wickerhamomyces pijperi TaxID=599730 RepID=A0A9P8Q922_WICPI|nr:hypothetical protein WICPIJ_002670 [Wickerhamomyces pijperi]